MFRDFLGNFYMILFSRMWGEIEPTWGEIEMNIGKLRTQKNSKFFFQWRGPLVGGVGYARWGMRGGVCEVRYTRWDTRGEIYMRQDLHQVRFTWGEIYMRWALREVGYAKWDLREVRFTRVTWWKFSLLDISDFYFSLYNCAAHLPIPWFQIIVHLVTNYRPHEKPLKGEMKRVWKYIKCNVLEHLFGCGIFEIWRNFKNWKFFVTVHNQSDGHQNELMSRSALQTAVCSLRFHCHSPIQASDCKVNLPG